MLGMEDTGSRMTRIGKSELVYGEMMQIDDILTRIDAVTLDDVSAVAGELLDGVTCAGSHRAFRRHARLLVGGGLGGAKHRRSGRQGSDGQCDV